MKNGATPHLPSQNEGRGFYGTIGNHAEANDAWRVAMHSIANATACPYEAVRRFLDSRYGRLFAHEVADALARGRDLPGAIEDAVEHWVERRTDDRLEDELGIPKGLPHLMGLVRMHQALLELAAGTSDGI